MKLTKMWIDIRIFCTFQKFYFHHFHSGISRPFPAISAGQNLKIFKNLRFFQFCRLYRCAWCPQILENFPDSENMNKTLYFDVFTSIIRQKLFPKCRFENRRISTGSISAEKIEILIFRQFWLLHSKYSAVRCSIWSILVPNYFFYSKTIKIWKNWKKKFFVFFCTTAQHKSILNPSKRRYGCNVPNVRISLCLMCANHVFRK